MIKSRISLIGFIFLLMTLPRNSVRGQHKHGVTFQLSQMQDWKSPMEIDVRSMHRFCTGECFYIPESCKNTLKALNCKNIVAIQKYEPPCHNPEATDSTDLCTRQGHLFIVSVLRTVSQGIVEPKRYIYKTDEYGYDIRCKVEPFVAISFSNNTEDYLTPTDPEQNKLGDVFYVCVAGDPYVTAWVKPKKKLPKTTPSCLDDFNPSESLGGTLENMQLLDTRPYPPMGPAVLWSKITTRYDQLAMGCKFVISNLRKDLSIQLNINGTVQVPLFTNKYIKIANGLAYSKDGRIEDVIFSNVERKSIAVVRDMSDEASLTVFPGLVSWNLSSMALPISPSPSFIRNLRNQIAAKEMRKVYDLCDQTRALCFTRGDEPVCSTKKSCHYLFAVQALNPQFSSLRFYLLAQPLRRPGIYNRVHPKSWSGVGFSNDTKMGKDLIFVCEFYGENEPVVKAAYNADSMSIFTPDNEPSLVDLLPVTNFVDSSIDATLCIFDVSTVNITFPAYFYSPSNTSNSDSASWTPLHFSLTRHEFYVLMAQGTTVYHDEKISKHTHRGVSPLKFSQKIYWGIVGGQGSLFTLKNPSCLLLIPSILTIVCRKYLSFFFL